MSGKKLRIVIVTISVFFIIFCLMIKHPIVPQVRDTKNDFVMNIGNSSFVKFLYLHPKKAEIGYFLAATEVTIIQYQEVMSDHFLPTKSVVSILDELKPVNSIMAKDAITGISEMNIKEFIARLAKKSGFYIRIPTETEWKYAASYGIKGYYSRRLSQSATSCLQPEKLLGKADMWGFSGMTNQIAEVTVPKQKEIFYSNGIKDESVYMLMGKRYVSPIVTKHYLSGSLCGKFDSCTGLRLACSANELGKPKLISEAQRGENVR